MSDVASIERDGGRLVLARYLEPLAPYLADKTLTEIVVNRPGEIFVEGPDGWTRHEAADLTYAYLSHLATAAAGHTRQDIGPEHPVVSTTLIGRTLSDRGPAGGRDDQPDDPQAIDPNHDA